MRNQKRKRRKQFNRRAVRAYFGSDRTALYFIILEYLAVLEKQAVSS